MANKEPCPTCGATDYYYSRVIFAGHTSYHECSECSKRTQPGLSPDVFFDSSKGAFQTDPNLCGRDGKPIPFSSKREKSAILRQLGLRESGDRVHGSRNFDKSASRQWKRFS